MAAPRLPKPLSTFAAALGAFVIAIPTPAHGQTVDLQVFSSTSEFMGGPAISPLNTSAGGTVTVSPWVVTNTGTGGAGPFTVGMYLSLDNTIDPTGNADVLIRSVTVPSLAGGASSAFTASTFALPATLPANQYYFGFFVDDGGQIVESDENDNAFVGFERLRVLPPVNADLVPSMFAAIAAPGPLIYCCNQFAMGSAKPLRVAPEATITLAPGRVVNSGTEDASSFTVGYFLSSDAQIERTDRSLGSMRVDGVPAGGAVSLPPVSITLPRIAEPDQYFIGVLIDLQDQVVERYGGMESNNAYATAITILPASSESTPVFRARLRLDTCNRQDAGTNDAVAASLGSGNLTWLDYSHNDFERRGTQTYDLQLDGISTFGDIDRLEIALYGRDKWCLFRADLFLNDLDVAAFSRSFTGGHWLEAWGDTPSIVDVAQYLTLKDSPRWPKFGWPALPPQLLTGGDLLSMVQSVVGHSIHGTAVRWRGGSAAVRITRQAPGVMHVLLPLEVKDTDAPLDLEFDMKVTCSCEGMQIEMLNSSASLDLGFWEGLATHGLSEWLEGTVGNAIGTAVGERLSEESRTFPVCLNPEIVTYPGSTVVSALKFEFPAIGPDAEIQVGLSGSALNEWT